MTDPNGNLYIGRIVDPATGRSSNKPLHYEIDDLTTHAVVVGMTGSGKTGLCIDLLEEAALNKIPALMIDPKGDITNALLHFPELRAEDFQPWINPDLARRGGKTVEQAASEAAENAHQGLADWNITPQRLSELKNAVQFAVFTPGSEAGIPLSILSSLKAPSIPWETNREQLREQISGTVTAILGLVGLTDIDPVRSREHILLANIFENAWSQGKDLDLSGLILQTQNPPFSRLGVFDINSFFSEKDRFSLAMQLNNILASPAFQSWIEGEPLDIPSMLYTPDGRPRHSIFYIAHLPDSERMFFVTLLLSAVEGWMRSQPGTSTLRAIVYFDEIFGYLPPVENPPSKQPMLRLLKQARAFGVGQVLVTQNPVDLDYKALSNAGTWFIGKLQTEQDKQRLLDGLQGANPGGMNRSEYERLISGLGKRVFLLHNVHNAGPMLFQTRWAMNYLAGPLTRAQIPALNRLANAAPSVAAAQVDEKGGATTPAVKSPPTTTDQTPAPSAVPTASSRPKAVTLTGESSTTRPTVPSGISEYVLPNNITFNQAFKYADRALPSQAQNKGLIYRPALLAQYVVRFNNRKYSLDYELRRAVLVPAPDRRGIIRWGNFPFSALEPAQLDSPLAPGARFAALESPFTESRALNALQKDFLDWAYRTCEIIIRANNTLKLYAGPETSEAEFRRLCSDTARQGCDMEIEKVSAVFDKKLEAIQNRVDREERELDTNKDMLSQRKMEELGTNVENFISLFGGRRSSRRLTSSLSKRRMTQQAKADVKESKDEIADLKKQIAALEREKAAALEEVNDRWAEIARQIIEIPIKPLKKDVLIDLYGVVWFPYHCAQIVEEMVELPGFSATYVGK